MPHWLAPMAATLTQERFTGPEWIFERKLDGIRLLGYKRGADVELFSRNRLPQNDAYPGIVRAVSTGGVQVAFRCNEHSVAFALAAITADMSRPSA